MQVTARAAPCSKFRSVTTTTARIWPREWLTLSSASHTVRPAGRLARGVPTLLLHCIRSIREPLSSCADGEGRVEGRGGEESARVDCAPSPRAPSWKPSEKPLEASRLRQKLCSETDGSAPVTVFENVCLSLYLIRHDDTACKLKSSSEIAETEAKKEKSRVLLSAVLMMTQPAVYLSRRIT